MAALHASIACRPTPLRVFGVRRTPARAMRASVRVFAAVDKSAVSPANVRVELCSAETGRREQTFLEAVVGQMM